MKWPLPCAGLAIVLAATVGGLAPASAADLSGPALVSALQRGGYVLVMRHAASPQAPPSAAEADPGNLNHERQLDAAGEAAAIAMGRAIATLRIRIGQVWSSPTYRALETARLAGFPKPMTAPEIGDHGQSMSAATAGQSAWLKDRAAERPKAGTDTILITHQPNIAAAFGRDAQGLGDGEALVFRPEGHGHAELVGRVQMADWPKLAGS
jgi:phosphohistidine phosphatase SixA